MLRGEGSGGVIPWTTPKFITCQGLEITSADNNKVCEVALDPALTANPRALTIHANDVSLNRFAMRTTVPPEESTSYGIAFDENVPAKGHRLQLQDLEVSGFQRCLTRDGGAGSTPLEDVLLERCFIHSFTNHGAYINYGFTRLHAKNSRFFGRVGSEKHATHDAFYGGSNWTDCLLEDCEFGYVTHMGAEVTNAGYISTGIDQRRTKFVRCFAHDCGSFGFSSGFCKGVLFDTCTAKDVQGAGFEIAGRHPQYVPQPGEPPTPDDGYAQGTLHGCIVDGVTGPGSDAAGYTIDGAFDVHVSGPTQISNISSAFNPAGAHGIQIHACERVHVRGAVIKYYGGHGIRIRRLFSNNASGFHVLEGNSFYNKVGDVERVGIYIEDTTASLRNNINWAAPGTTMNNQANTARPARAIVDGVAAPAGLVYLAGSNVTIPQQP